MSVLVTFNIEFNVDAFCHLWLLRNVSAEELPFLVFDSSVLIYQPALPTAPLDEVLIRMVRINELFVLKPGEWNQRHSVRRLRRLSLTATSRRRTVQVR